MVWPHHMDTLMQIKSWGTCWISHMQLTGFLQEQVPFCHSRNILLLERRSKLYFLPSKSVLCCKSWGQWEHITLVTIKLWISQNITKGEYSTYTLEKHAQWQTNIITNAVYLLSMKNVLEGLPSHYRDFLQNGSILLKLFIFSFLSSSTELLSLLQRREYMCFLP